MHCHVHHKHSIPFRLEAAEDRYSNRESRPEDVDAIRELKKLVSQQEFMLKEAIVSYIRSHWCSCRVEGVANTTNAYCTEANV